MRAILLIFALGKALATNTCHSTIASSCCLASDFQTCHYCPGQCSVAGTGACDVSTCSGTPKVCSGALSQKAIATPIVDLTPGEAQAEITPTQNYLDYFTNSHSQECSTVQCKLVLASGSVCDPSSPDISQMATPTSYTSSPQGHFKINSAQEFDLEVCAACSTTTTPNWSFSTAFTLKSQPCTQASFVDLAPVVGTLDPNSPFTGVVGTSGSISIPKLADSSSYSCPISSYKLWAETSASAHPDLSITQESASLKISSATISSATTFKFRLVAMVGGNDIVYENSASNSIFTWSFAACSAPSSILSQGPFDAPYAGTQYVALSSSDGFVLPQFVSSDPNCPIQSLAISSQSTTLSPVSGLEDPAFDGSRWVVKPTTSSAHAQFTFYVQFKVTGSISKFSSVFNLYVGCGGDIAITEGSYPSGSGFGDEQWSSKSAGSRFYLPIFSTPSSVGCPILQYKILNSQSETNVNSNLATPVEDPDNGRLYTYATSTTDNTRYVFYILAKASNGRIRYSSQKILYVGCPDNYITKNVGSFPAGYSATQFIKLSTPHAQQRFVFPEFTSSIAGCPATNFRISRYGSSYGTQSTLKDATFDSTTGLYGAQINPRTTSKLQNFYIFVSASGTGTEFKTSQYTVVIGCYTPYSGFSISAPTIAYSQTIKSTECIEFNKVTFPNVPSCEVEFYRMTTSTSTASPSYTNNFQPGVEKATDSSKIQVCPSPSLSYPHSQSYYIAYKIRGESTVRFIFSSHKRIEVVQGCEPSSTTITVSGGGQVTQFVQNSGTLQFTLPGFVSSNSGCPVATIQTIQVSGATVSSPSPSGSNYKVTTTGSDVIVKFKAKATADGGATLTTGELSLVIGCPSDFSGITITEGGYLPLYGAQQEVHISNSGSHPTYYVTNDFSTDVMAYCPLAMRVSSDSSSFVQHPGLEVVTETVSGSPRFVVRPLDVSVTEIYTFYLEAKVAGTTFLSGEKKLVVGCPASSYTVSAVGQPAPSPLFIGSGIDFRPSAYNPPVVTSSYSTTCVITDIEVVDVKKDGAMDPTQVVVHPDCSGSSCTDIVLGDTAHISTSTFKFKVIIGYGSQSWTSDTRSQEVTCHQNTTSITFPPVDPLETFFKDTGVVHEIGKPVCSTPECCKTLTFFASTDPVDFTQAQTLVTAMRDGPPGFMEVVVDTTEIRMIQFYLFAVNPFNTVGVTSLIDVDVVYDCSKDIFSLSKVPPTDGERQALRDKGIYAMRGDKSYSLLVVLKLEDSLEVDLSKRFAQDAPPGSCPFSEFKIEKVVDPEGAEVEQKIWGATFNMSEGGLFQVHDAKEELKHRIYVSVFNGKAWSKGMSTGPLLDFTIASEDAGLPDVAPQFMEPLKDEKIQIEPGVRKMEMALPEVYDAKGDGYSITLGEAPAFVKLDSGKLIVDLSGVKASTDKTVEIIIEGESGSSTTYQLQLNLEVPTSSDTGAQVYGIDPTKQGSASESGAEKPSSTGNGSEKPPLALSAWVASVDYFGVVKVKFNATLAALDLNSLKASGIDIYVAGQEPLSSSAWKIDKIFKRSELHLLINFTNPLAISAGDRKDRLVLAFSDEARAMLRSPDTGTSLHQNYARISGPIPKQMPQTKATQSLVSSAQ